MPDIDVLECHVPNMVVSKEGLKNYYWPISNQERRGFSMALVEAYADLVKRVDKENQVEALPYKFFGIHFLTQVVAVFQGDLLRERTRADNKTVHVPDNWAYWPYLLQEREPSEPGIIKKLMAQPENTSLIRKVLKPGAFKKAKKLLQFKKKGIQIDGLLIKPITTNVLKDDVIATERISLIIDHAAAVDKDVVFCRSNRWFSSISEEELNAAIAGNNKNIEAEIMEMVSRCYSAFDIDLKAHSYRFILNLLQKGTALCRVHYERLIDKPETLPKEVWSGTTGQLWNTMLRVAVQNTGGKAVGHDHGSGTAFVEYPLMGTIEFWGCDEFVTFNKNHAEAMAATLKGYPVYDDRPPKMISLPSYPSYSGMKIFQRREEVKNIFVMATLFDNDRGRTGPGNVNNFLVDWQARLLSRLSDAGYNVTMKIHPENKVPLPEGFAEKMGVKVTSEPFGKIMDQADLVIFDCIYTTAFSDCLATNLPILVFDIFGFPWVGKGEELINKRCEILKTDYINQRAEPNWDEVMEAVKRAPAKADNHEFYQYYFG